MRKSHSLAAKTKLVELDAMRGAAAICVVLYHIGFYNGSHIAPRAYLAVDFFFVLSGFVIGRTYVSLISRNELTIGRFVVKRVLRLYPMYFCGILLGGLEKVAQCSVQGSAAFPCHRIPMMIAASFLMIPIPAMGGLLFPLNVPSWSLYLEFIMVFAFAIASKANGYVLLLLPPIAITILMLGIDRFNDMNLGWTIQTVHFGYARIALSFPIGVALSCVSRRWRPTLKASLLPTSLLLFVLLGKENIPAVRYSDLFISALFFPTLVLLGSLVVTPTSMRRFQELLGRISYPMYIVHFPILSVLTYLDNSYVQGDKILITAAEMAIIFAASYACTIWLDAPISKILNNWLDNSSFGSEKRLRTSISLRR